MGTYQRSRWRALGPLALFGLLVASVVSAARPAARAAGLAASPVTLTVWWSDWGASFDKLMEQSTDNASAFHKQYPNITVKWSFYPNYSQKLLTAAAAGAPPDLTYINSNLSQLWAQKGILTPLNTYFTGAGLKRADFVEASFPPYEYNGKLYGLLNTGDFQAVLWNKDMFRAAGLPDHGPRTIQELGQYNARLFKIQNGRIVQAGLFPDQVGLQAWGLQFGGQFVDRTHHKITANDPHIVAALQWMLDQSRTWGQANEDRFRGVGPSNQLGTEQPNDLFYHNKVAMEWQGDFDFLTEAQYAPTMHVGVSALPTAGYGLRLWDGISWGTAIPKGSSHPDAAWTLMRYLTTGPQAPTVIAQTANFLAYMPLVPQFFQQTYKILGDKNPMRQDFHVFQDTILPHTTAQPYYDIPIASVYDSALATAVANVLHGRDTPRHALDAVTQQVQRAWDAFVPGQ